MIDGDAAIVTGLERIADLATTLAGYALTTQRDLAPEVAIDEIDALCQRVSETVARDLVRAGGRRRRGPSSGCSTAPPGSCSDP